MASKLFGRVAYTGNLEQAAAAHYKHVAKAFRLGMSYSELMRKGADGYQKPSSRKSSSSS